MISVVFTFAVLFIFAGQTVSGFVNVVFSLMKNHIYPKRGYSWEYYIRCKCGGMFCKTLWTC
jgi:hypothetical protein